VAHPGAAGRLLGSIFLPTSSKTAQLAAKIAQDSPTSTQHGLLGQIFFDLASIRDPKPSKNLQKP